eukprot:snap_masked-scaffold_40-processed-gene-2.12-mRNA-1 protein AED:1.00 eAED:1.00 QI:0/-1/0/0/-1/1/1/0/110
MGCLPVFDIVAVLAGSRRKKKQAAAFGKVAHRKRSRTGSLKEKWASLIRRTPSPLAVKSEESKGETFEDEVQILSLFGEDVFSFSSCYRIGDIHCEVQLVLFDIIEELEA